MIYVTSDWLGCDLKTVKALLKKADFKESDFCFVLGNVTDCGEHGVELLEWLMEQYNVELILGAHEQLLLANEFLFEDGAVPDLTPAQAAVLKKWNELGALPTVTALKKKKAQAREYIFEYLQEAPLYETVSAGGKDYLLTHSGIAGFDPAKKLSDYAPEAFLWNVPKLTDRYFKNAVTVFGHTPAGELDPESEGKPLFTDTWIDICTGAGPLLLRLEDGKAFSVSA